MRAAVESGELTPERYASYQALQQEMAAMRDRREEARRMNKEKVSDTKRRRAGAPKGGRRPAITRARLRQYPVYGRGGLRRAGSFRS